MSVNCNNYCENCEKSKGILLGDAQKKTPMQDNSRIGVNMFHTKRQMGEDVWPGEAYRLTYISPSIMRYARSALSAKASSWVTMTRVCFSSSRRLTRS